MHFDLDTAVVGGGPAGISAAINLKIRGKSAGLFTNSYRDSGLFKAKLIDNVPGLPAISGEELLEKLYAHLTHTGIEPVKGQVLSIARVGDGFYVSAGTSVVSARTVILATGAAQSSFYPGETRLLGRGVSYCASCDGPLYKGKEVAVLGLRGDAPEEANELCEIGCKVCYVDCGAGAKGLKPEISVIQGGDISFEGGDKLEAVKIDGQAKAVTAAFVVRFSVAPAYLLPGLDVKDGYISVTGELQTNIPGVFAAGDCTGLPHQISRASGQGQTAAFYAARFMST